MFFVAVYEKNATEFLMYEDLPPGMHTLHPVVEHKTEELDLERALRPIRPPPPPPTTGGGATGGGRGSGLGKADKNMQDGYECK